MSIDRRAHNVCYLAENGSLFMFTSYSRAVIADANADSVLWLFVFASTTTARSDARTTKCTQIHTEQPIWRPCICAHVYKHTHVHTHPHIHRRFSSQRYICIYKYTHAGNIVSHVNEMKS